MTKRQYLLSIWLPAALLGCAANDTVYTPPVSPTSVAGKDQIVQPNTLVTLDGTGSSDPLGRQLGYHWSIASAPTGSTAAIAMPFFSKTTITPDLEGTYDILLVVSAGTEQEGSTMHIYASYADAGM